MNDKILKMVIAIYAKKKNRRGKEINFVHSFLPASQMTPKKLAFIYTNVIIRYSVNQSSRELQWVEKIAKINKLVTGNNSK